MTQVNLDFQAEPSSLPGSDFLESLSLRGCCEWVTDEVIEHLSAGGKLSTINLFRCWRVTDKGILELVRRNGAYISSLELSGCSGITDKSLEAISKFCTNLKSIDLTRCNKITDIGINYLCESGKHTIETLLLYANSSLGTSSYCAIAQLEQLKRLDLCGHENLTSSDLICILGTSGDKVEYLNLSWCVSLTDLAVADFVENTRLGCIEYLSLFGIKNFTRRPMQVLVGYLQTRKRLKQLDVRGIPSISDLTENDCLELRRSLPGLEKWKLHH